MSDELRQAIEAELATYAIADYDCPARNGKPLGDKLCPRCGAGASFPCGDDVMGAYAFIAAVQRILEQQP